MSVESLSAAAGIMLTLCASYLPGFAAWFEPLAPNAKRLIMLGLLALTSIAAYSMACMGLGGEVSVNLTCDQQGALTIGRAFISALIANQAAYAISPKLE